MEIMTRTRTLAPAARRWIILACLCAATAPAANVPAAERLRVSENGRFIETASGQPFFYLGDTAWELFHRLDREEAELYLRNRAEKGFTVIQAVVLPQLGLDVPNALGDLALDGLDPRRPNEAYFRHVDWIVERAAELGLRIGMLPTWGSHWRRFEVDSPPVFNADNARAFGLFLGKRYARSPIIWILGGDENIRLPEERAVIDALAAGLREGDGGEHLITFHPRGPGRSSDQVHDAEWLDFNMSQSSHGGRDHDNGLFVQHDYGLAPTKPTLDGEPRYERIPVGFYFRNFSRHDRFDDYDVRQAAYWSLLAGACGHTYGHNSVWQMWAPGREAVIQADVSWREALDHPGAFQMKFVRRLFEARPFHRLEPAQDFILDGPDRGGAKIRAALAADPSFAVVYSPRGERFTADLTRLKAERVRETWYDPRYGVSTLVHETDTPNIQTYTPPTSGRGQDWILILDDASADLPPPPAEAPRP